MPGSRKRVTTEEDVMGNSGEPGLLFLFPEISRPSACISFLMTREHDLAGVGERLFRE